MVASKLYIEIEAKSGTESVIKQGFASRLMDTLEPSSVGYLIRFSSDAVDVSASSTRSKLHALFSETLPEPCKVELIPCDSKTLAVVVLPDTNRAMDPLQVHSLMELFRSTLAKELPAGANGDTEEVVLLPIAPVASVTGLQENLSALNELLETLLNKQMRVQFQPIIHFASGKVFGYESLIRMPQTGNLKRAGMYFHAADRARLVSWLDVACQEQCFESASKAGVRDHLFINMDAEGLTHLQQADQSLADRAAEFGIAPSRVVLEITERQAVEDFPRLTQYIEQLREQGFKIAIDDAGAGYSSLHTIAELRPEFVKIDRSLVRTIENSPTRRALLSTLTHYAHQIGAQVIAEGLETRDELATVVEMGVPYGQGYLLGKPNDGFKSLRGEMQEFLGKHLERKDNRVAGRDYPIEKMARYGVTLPSSSPNTEVARKFSRMPDMESVVLVDEGRIEGLIMRDRFDELYKPVGEDDPAMAAPISSLMDRQPLVVEAGTKLEDVAQRATYRRTMRFHDDIVVGHAGEYVGVVPVRALLEALSTRHVNRLKYAHPLTGLPGSPIIEQACDSRLQSEQATVVIHVGIAHFRAFNDYFGLAMGDEALLTAARLLEQTLLRLGAPDDFLGHIGGDNFVLLTNPELAPSICSACSSEFELLAPHLYTPEQRRDGAFETVDGQGKSLRTPLMSLRMTGVSTSKRQLTHFRQAMQLLKSVQRAAITTPERRFIID